MPTANFPHGDIQLCNNVLILTVNNMLSGWPTYVIDFTVENLGPMKLLLHLKDPSKYVLNEDEEDQDSSKTPDASIQKKRDNTMLSVDISA
ncbi:hypothetical protein BDN67DRAFT_1016027 [Paxillus ammoniavirescens]|nr:hypothetical protein BDN67DRAFT_1016027 [Paxillus ammoniavirescens]